ncbi:hypothetical protein C1645_813714 [Glomus cerebriforme]|uniref:DUF659 domain-containing protein n=1 Tax=Glomus cerebriforme TaxID=658196 RepID=A0A397TMH1_9GLOM|nr:hypothetical protein C1645_813714 [Glomus cerebriforme]
MNDYIKCEEHLEKFEFAYNDLLTVVNNPEARELFNFLNPLIKLPDHCEFEGKILTKAVEKVDDTMEITFKEDPVESENHTNVIEKIESILTELEQKEINICAIITDSTGAYAAARLPDPVPVMNQND